MKYLVLVRHAKASWAVPGQGDFERPLNPRGQRDAPEMGRRLAARGFAPDLFLASPAVRAHQTARNIARQLDFPREDIEWEPAIYEASAEDLLAILRGLDPGATRALLVGHNPGFTDLVNALTGADLANLPTCGVAEIDLAVDAWAAVAAGAGRLPRLDTPKRPLPAEGRS